MSDGVSAQLGKQTGGLVRKKKDEGWIMTGG